ncbi:uncharacterized protein LOC110461816 [Mizuhopecten yessoensis]|uniref:Uncharacterized protein n=1 Tax=Mizuhopecten yessoensis TaxID=6573 RepID=A0A210R720_MIZYE|nr:uncharacterized protein LOC110461816 [Mizuhopecten yessoensis]OWF56857.1 hypothetical protein KP79_PYT20217 [Mizuhopecten yessoensis]
MSILTSGQSLLVCLIALCFIHVTDTHIPPVRQTNLPVTNSGSVGTVRDLLTADQLRSIRTRWTAKGLNPSRLESMLRSNSRDFITQHNQRATAAASLGPRTDPRTSDPVQPRRGRSRLQRLRPRDPIGLRGSINGDRRNGQLVNPNGLAGRNIERTGHEGHNHGSIGQNRIASRRDRRNRRGRQPNGVGGGQQDMRTGVQERIPLGELGISGGEPDVGLEQSITDAELRLLRREPNGVGVEGIATGGVRQERIRNRNNRQDRTRIDPLGRPIDMTRVLTDGIQTRGRNQNGRRIDGHEHGHEHGHGNGHVDNRQHRQSRLGDIPVDLVNRRRGGVERLDGTREREGLIRLRARNNAVNVVQPHQGTRRRRRNGLGRVLRNFVGTLFG